MPLDNPVEVLSLLIRDSFGVMAAKFAVERIATNEQLYIKIPTDLLRQLGGREALRAVLEKAASTRRVELPKFEIRLTVFTEELQQLCCDIEKFIEQIGGQSNGVSAELQADGAAVSVIVAMPEIPSNHSEISVAHEISQIAITRNFETVSVQFSLSNRPVSLLQILLSIKTLQPATVQEISTDFAKRGMHGDVKMIQNAVDNLRKQGLVVHDASRKLALTREGIAAIPVNRGRMSSDIIRALHLGRKFR